MYTVTIKEREKEYLVSWYKDGMPAFEEKEYPTLAAALDDNQSYNWREPDESDEIDGDIVLYAYYR